MKGKTLLCVFVALLSCSAGFASAEDLVSAVRVGTAPVSAAEVASALHDCRVHAPEVGRVACLDAHFVPRWLLDREATSRGLEKSPALTHVRAEFLGRLVAEKMSQEQPAPSQPEVDAYMKAHQRDFEKPLRIRIFRVLLNEESAAKKLLGELTPLTTIEEFRKRARELSVDLATNERGGDLGFVWPDGSTDVPQVSADRGLYEAALALQDGEIGPEPVREGERFAVIWRRGSLPAALPDEAGRQAAAAALREKKTEEGLSQLLEGLGKDIQGRNDEPLGKLRRKEARLFVDP